ncbi:hypothetical protein BGZ95_003705 [Linnemannia exigua]|uniref:Uncharacterized protein n=1 Tax=Linnemannia exigua TaxID=604196 RepID=A0AAD4D3Y1_9FUNG|nr:hypothetical protein BGZ95_003705 [Linnemannia exigua]
MHAPSSSSSSADQQSQEEGSLLSPLTSQTPVKKPNSSKCAKMVSFKEPEPWRDITPPTCSSSAMSSAQSEKKEDRQGAKQVRMLFTPHSVWWFHSALIIIFVGSSSITPPHPSSGYSTKGLNTATQIDLV